MVARALDDGLPGRSAEITNWAISYLEVNYNRLTLVQWVSILALHLPLLMLCYWALKSDQLGDNEAVKTQLPKIRYH